LLLSLIATPRVVAVASEPAFFVGLNPFTTIPNEKGPLLGPFIHLAAGV
jgi:hypothetical protein